MRIYIYIYKVYIITLTELNYITGIKCSITTI